MGRKTGKTKNIFLVIIVLGVISIAALSASGLAQMDWTKTGEETGSVFSGTITAYKDGQPVSTPILLGSFTRGEQPIDSLVLDIHWVSTGDSVDWSTFNLDGSVKVGFLNDYDNYLTEYSTTFTSVEHTGDWSKILVLGTDICKPNNILSGGWLLKFEVTLTGSVEDTIGQTLSDTVHFAGTTTISYISDYSLDGYAEW